MSTDNFHGHIALPLETICKLYVSNNPSIPITADNIESGEFAAIMALMLCHKYRAGMPEEVSTFVKSCLDIFGISGNAIHFSEAESMFRDFKKYIEA